MLDAPSKSLDTAIADLIWTSMASETPPVMTLDVQVVPGTYGSDAGTVGSVHIVGHVISPCARVWYWNASKVMAAGWGYSHVTVASPYVVVLGMSWGLAGCGTGVAVTTVLT